jgi:hypothetical protein
MLRNVKIQAEIAALTVALAWAGPPRRGAAAPVDGASAGGTQAARRGPCRRRQASMRTVIPNPTWSRLSYGVTPRHTRSEKWT